jgi:superfamily II DNA or RNA helicase
MSYADFVSRKLDLARSSGLTANPADAGLFDYQQALVRWAIRKGRAAIFADTGLGKTRMQISWAQAVATNTGGDILILAPLAVAAQTVAEAESVGIRIKLCRSGDDVDPGINITNYDRLHLFDTDRFVGVVLDESSVIKHHTSKRLQVLLDGFGRTPYKLCATATPAPNDWTELGTHAEFLGVCTRSEMLSEYFVHDGGETQVWRLKGHAKKEFWRFVASWGAMVRNPSDLGFDGSRLILPPLNVHEHLIKSDLQTAQEMGFLFPMQAGDLMERRKAKRASIKDRVKACAERVNATTEPFLIWCDLNDEADALLDAIPGAVEVRGSDDIDAKERNLIGFSKGDIRVMITKPKIAGWGLNWQHCNQIAFVGVNDSYESYYQAIRRCWRFGQNRPVDVHLYVSEAEGSIMANLLRKESEAAEMARQLSTETRESVMSELLGQQRRTNAYDAIQRVEIPSWITSCAS